MILNSIPIADILLLQNHRLSSKNSLKATTHLSSHIRLGLWNNGKFIPLTNRVVYGTAILLCSQLASLV